MPEIFLYYSQTLDGTVLPTLSEIESQQKAPNKDTVEKVQHLMDYSAMYLDAYIRFYANNTLLTVYTDTYYLILPKARISVSSY